MLRAPIAEMDYLLIKMQIIEAAFNRSRVVILAFMMLLIAGSLSYISIPKDPSYRTLCPASTNFCYFRRKRNGATVPLRKIKDKIGGEIKRILKLLITRTKMLRIHIYKL